MSTFPATYQNKDMVVDNACS